MLAISQKVLKIGSFIQMYVYMIKERQKKAKLLVWILSMSQWILPLQNEKKKVTTVDICIPLLLF